MRAGESGVAAATVGGMVEIMPVVSAAEFFNAQLAHTEIVSYILADT